MIGQFLITFREVLEASLVTAIILAYLARTGKNPMLRYVWYGVFLSLAFSVALGAMIWLVHGTLAKSTQVLFEGSAALIAVVVLSSMIYWMATKGQKLRIEVERRVEAIMTRGATFSLISFSFIVVFREGLETILFLAPFFVSDAQATLAGALLGTVASLAFAYTIFVVGMKINIRRFFYYTSILLLLLAGGLAGYGVHEFLEYAKLGGIEVGWPAQIAYDLNVPSDSIFHHKGVIGSVLAVMFGYTVKAEWARLIVHITYLLVAVPLVITAYRGGLKRRPTAPESLVISFEPKVKGKYALTP